MVPFIELLIFLVLCIIAMGVQGIAVFAGICALYFGLLYLLGKVSDWEGRNGRK